LATSHIFDLTVDQAGIAARACDVHRQMLVTQSKQMPDGWKKEQTLKQIDDLQAASDLLKSMERALLDE